MKKMAVVVMLILLLTITGCKKLGESQETQVQEQTQSQKATKEVISNLKCTDGSIAGTVTNTGNETIDVLKDVKVILRGMAVAPTLLACDKSTLKPGESTSCAKLNGVYPIIETNRILVRIGESNIEKEITCR